MQTINNITVWGRTDCCPEMSSNFYVFVSDNPFTSYDLNTTINQSGVYNYLHSGYAGPASIPVSRTGRYVRVQLAGTQSLALGEVQVWSAAAKVNWLVTDQLGTPRMIVDKTGTLAGVSRHDYLPFGEELFAGTGGRTTAQGYVADTVRQKFTLKERDNETGLDYFGARYYASTQGRFTSIDPLLASGRIRTPQSWNRYAYVLNNPLRYIDPDGRYNQDVHYDLTRLIAMAVGFPFGPAARIAMANQSVDDNQFTTPMPNRHGAGVNRRKKYHFTTEGTRQEHWDHFASTGDADDLGIYLHALQDSYSHRGLSPINGQVTSPAFWNWPDADDTWRDVGKADVMAEDTYNRLDWGADIMEGKGTLTGRFKPMSWGQISDVVHNFNAASNEAEKRYHLMILEGRVKNWWSKQLKEMEDADRKRRQNEKGQF